ncbi:hypothetical protein P7K49_020455 [Saguinus oedipus]|uniref:Uncharacterized protein n=1 Tax=Saguinus oedipus TaxID=9490 RepID=A0ABQ9V252_SAGOE|nr:hypothetical protein P7K49_020455 [Saguinus oedipus]
MDWQAEGRRERRVLPLPEPVALPALPGVRSPGWNWVRGAPRASGEVPPSLKSSQPRARSGPASEELVMGARPVSGVMPPYAWGLQSRVSPWALPDCIRDPVRREDVDLNPDLGPSCLAPQP